MARQAISPRLAISTVVNMFMPLNAGEIVAPAAKLSDIRRVFQRPGFADKPLHPPPVRQQQRADAQWRRDFRHKLAETGQRDVPQLNADRRPCAARASPGFGGSVSASAYRR